MILSIANFPSEWTVSQQGLNAAGVAEADLKQKKREAFKENAG